MRHSVPTRLGGLLTASGIALSLLSGTATAGGFLFHKHHGQTAYVVAQPTTVQAVAVVPVTHLQLGTVMTGHGLHLGPLQAPLTVSPTGLTTSAVPTTYYVVQGSTPGTGLTTAPQPQPAAGAQ